MSKDIKELLEKANITEEMVEEARSGESLFLLYAPYSASNPGTSINLEIIAPNFVEVLLKLDTEDQENLVLAILSLVPEVGDTQVITDNRGSDKKRRGGRVTQVKSERNGEIQLLITR